MSKRPVVFLDIDDVLCLNTAYTGYDAEAALRPVGGQPTRRSTPPDLWDRLFALRPRTNLRALHEEFNPWYVVSSSWRTSFSRGGMETVFRETGIAFVAEHLHEIWRTADHKFCFNVAGARRNEILEWIARWHDEKSPWIALDDFESGESLVGHSNAVLCEPGVGFATDKLEQARDLLRMSGE